jgi:hypothetical protein
VKPSTSTLWSTRLHPADDEEQRDQEAEPEAVQLALHDAQRALVRLRGVEAHDHAGGERADEDVESQLGWSARLGEDSPSTVARDIPLLVAQGLTDDLVRRAVTEAFVSGRCADGASIELDTYADTGHFALRATAAPSVAEWLLARLGGTPAPSGCSTASDEQPARAIVDAINAGKLAAVRPIIAETFVDHGATPALAGTVSPCADRNT